MSARPKYTFAWPTAHHLVRDVAVAVAVEAGDGVADVSEVETREEGDAVASGAGLAEVETEVAVAEVGWVEHLHGNACCRVAEEEAVGVGEDEAGGASDAGASVAPGVCEALGGPWARCCQRQS